MRERARRELSAIVLGEVMPIWSKEAVVLTPPVALVFHEEEQAATGMSEVREAGLWIGVLAAPPREEMAAKGGKIAPPVGAA
jgi:hypothetical protein